MLKKIVVGAVVVGLIGVLVVGAINRTNARSWDNETRGNGRYSDAQVERGGRGQGATEEQRGGGRWNQTPAQPANPGSGQVEVTEWVTLEGTVQSVASDQVVVKTKDGKTVEIDGRGWQFAQESSFQLQAGDILTITGFYEDGEFKAAKITNQRTGKTFALRDDSGRPMWAGRGRGRSG